MNSALILLVEDDRGIRQILKEELAAAGHAVIETTDGAAAIAQLSSTEFDVVITDVRLPKASGLEVLQAVKASAPDAEVIVMTAHASLHLAIDCLRAGAFDFVQKPLKFENLLATVGRAIERRHLRAATALYEASLALLVAPKARDLPTRICDVARTTLASAAASLALPTPDGHLYEAASAGAAMQLPVNLDELATLRSPFAEGPGDSRREDDLGPMLHFPLRNSERLVGVLSLGRMRGSPPYRRGDIQRATVLGAQILLALENERLVDQLLASESFATLGRLTPGIVRAIEGPTTAAVLHLQDLGERVDALGGDSATVPSPALVQALERALADAREQVARIGDVVRDMRSLSQSEGAEWPWFDLNDAVRAAIRLAGDEIEPGLNLVTHLRPGVEVRGSPGQLSLVFASLLEEVARTLAQAVGRRVLTVSSRPEGERVIAEIVSSGPALSDDELQALFDPVLDIRRPKHGSMIGLPFCREIVNRHGGELKAASPPGQGTSFVVALPAASKGSAGASRSSSKIRVGNSG